IATKLADSGNVRIGLSEWGGFQKLLPGLDGLVVLRADEDHSTHPGQRQDFLQQVLLLGKSDVGMVRWQEQIALAADSQAGEDRLRRFWAELNLLPEFLLIVFADGFQREAHGGGAVHDERVGIGGGTGACRIKIQQPDEDSKQRDRGAESKPGRIHSLKHDSLYPEIDGCLPLIEITSTTERV